MLRFGSRLGLDMRSGWRRWLRASFALCALGASVVFAQDYKGPITLVVGYPAGGSADIGARILAEKLPALLGQPVVVENRAGAGGQIAARYVKGAPANGSVLFFTNGHTVVTVPLILKAPGFDTATDLKPVSPFASFELTLVVNPKTQARSVKDLTDYFARTPTERNIAVPAPGSAPEFIVGRFAQLTRTEVQPIAYKGTAPAVQDLLGGQVSAAVLPVADILQYQRAGKLQAVAVTHTTPLLPGVPSFSDAGLGELAASDFLAVYAPAGMSDANVARFHRAVQQVVAMPEVSERLLSYALQPQHGTPADLTKAYEASRTTVRGLMKAVDYQPQ
ncbi:tripartite tricarboxylate transporter substrate binding protein [soil metagenome]